MRMPDCHAKPELEQVAKHTAFALAARG